MYSSARQRSSRPPPSSSSNYGNRPDNRNNEERQQHTRSGRQQHQRQQNERGGSKSSDKKKTSTQNRQTLYLISASLLALAAWYLTPLSDFVVDILLLQVPIEADIELGKQVLRQEVSQKTVFHPEWTPQLQSIGWDLIDSAANSAKQQNYRTSSSTEGTTDHLASKMKLAKQYEWDFGVLRDPDTVNAFALPGGAIRVTTGLLQKLDLTSGELAALIGHEMGHVLHRHSQARILQQQFLSKVLEAAVYKDDDPHQESFGEALGKLLLSMANWLGSQSFSRTNEYEADATSWQLLLESKKFHPKALESLLTKLWEYHGRQGGKTSWESTHPGTLDRIEALKGKWEALTSTERRRLNQQYIHS